jgi:hypothetical protein
MKKALLRLAVLVPVACLFLSGAGRADPFLPVPPGSFINYHVDTVQQLSRQVMVDASVSGRLARHFHMPTQSIVDYLRTNLVLTRLTQTQTTRVWCVTPSGREYTIMERLPAGTPVFALASTHQPIFKRVCGNPLVAALPHIEAKQAPKPLKPPALVTKPTATAAVVPVSELALLPHENVVATALTGTSLTGPLVQVGSYSAVFNKAGTNFLQPALAIFGLALFSGGGGSSPGVTSGIPVPVITPPGGTSGSPPPAVPEPSTVMPFIVTGALFVILLVRARGRARLNRADYGVASDL